MSLKDSCVRALLFDVLGHERCAAAGGDLGGGVVQDLGLRFQATKPQGSTRLRG